MSAKRAHDGRINGVEIAESFPLRGMQKIVAERMLESQKSAASVTAMAEVDAGSLLSLYDRLRAEHPDLSLTHLLIKATALSLKRHPRMNATLSDGEVHELAEVNVSLALSLPPDDLHVAVIRDADEKPLATIVEETRSLRDRAASGKLTPSDVRGGTFTLSNYGMLRSVVWATPIITPGQVGVLGVARIRPGLVADSDDGWSVRPVLPLSLTYDHRIVNGVPAGRFLDDLVQTLADDNWRKGESPI